MTVFQRWIDGWIMIIEGIIKVITLGFIHPSLSYKFICWLTIRKRNNP